MEKKIEGERRAAGAKMGEGESRVLYKPRKGEGRGGRTKKKGIRKREILFLEHGRNKK